MSSVAPKLKWRTDPAWAAHILVHFDGFLVDHANCERKASALAMSLVVKYADRMELIQPLIELAQEELTHFRQVYTLMEQRGLRLASDLKDPYVNALIGLCRSRSRERFLDRMLVSSIIESRGAERFRLISEALQPPELKAFYRDLWASEAKHGTLFTALALKYFPAEELRPRLEELVTAEPGIAQALPWRASLH